MMCIGCLPGEKEKQRLLEKEELIAKAYAEELQKLVVIYWINEDKPGHMEAQAAKLANIQPVKFVSHL